MPVSPLRAPRLARSLALCAAALSSLATTACLEHPLTQLEVNKYSTCDDDVVVNPERDVDILFVIDNSGSMGEEQAILSQNFKRFVDKLDDANANYRIAITTTDVGNSIYCDDREPEDGAFVLSSCHDRIDDFVDDDIDKRDEACESLCPAEFAGAGTTPTPIVHDGEAAARPWIQSADGFTNLPADMGADQAFQCFGPQGIRGCGFNESPLAAMHRALERAQDPGDPAYGFLRENAKLAVVIITDENDCSLAEGAEDIFHPAGNHAFWQDPDAPVANSAVCWNAGVLCDAAGDCVAASYDANGARTEDPGEAVLNPLSVYDEALTKLEGDGHEVFISVIAGVPLDYPDSAIPYDLTGDPEFVAQFGVSPGCASETGKAAPPVRLKEFSAAYQGEGSNNMFSICADDYSPALDSLANDLLGSLQPSCMPACVADLDPETDGLQANCELTESYRDAGREIKRALPECARDDDGWATPDEGACYYTITGDTQPLADACVDIGANLQFEVLRAPGSLAPSGSTINADCQLSELPSVDCPAMINGCAG